MKKRWIVWEPTATQSGIVNTLRAHGFRVVATKTDFFRTFVDYDAIVTNPPYSQKAEFLARAYELGKPFAFLLPLTALEGAKRQALFVKHGVQLIIPKRRINFIMPSGSGSGSWFMSAWFTWGLALPKDIVFELANDALSF